MGKKSFYIFTFFLVNMLFLSCSGSNPEFKKSSLTIIFNYAEEKKVSDVYLAFFSETDTNARRIDTINLQSLETEYQWYTNELLKMQNSNIYYVGFNNFRMPAGKKFPTGNYKATINSLAEDESNVEVNLKYDEKLYDLTGSKVESYIKTKSYKKKIAGYTSEGNLIFFDELKSENSTLDRLFNNYPEITKYNEVYYSSNSQVYIILPGKNIENK